MGILDYYSLLIAGFDLIPAPPLEGATVWYLIPELIKRLRKRLAVGYRQAIYIHALFAFGSY
jgi:hypothetical protein